MASGIIKGTLLGNSASKYNLWVEWSSTPDPANNRSLVVATEFLQRNDGVSASAYNLDALAENKKININGSIYNNAAAGIDTRNGAKVQVVKHSAYVKHNASGSANAIIEAIIPYVTENLSGGRVYGEITLDDIDTNPLVISNFSVTVLSETSVEYSWEVNEVVDYAWYSLDGGKTWNNLPITNIIEGLAPNTQYSFRLRLRKQSTQRTTDSQIVIKTTSPVAIEDIQAEDVIVDVGETKVVQYSVLPGNASIKSLEIISGDTSIISVDGQTITGKSRGTTSLTLRAKDGSGISKIVAAEATQRVMGITTSTQSLTVNKNSVVELDYQILPFNANNKNVIITSSDDSVVSVSDGVITAIENGNALITITTEDGGYSIAISLLVVGNYTWYDFPIKLEVLNTEDIKKIFSNMKTIHLMLTAKGYAVAELKQIDARKDIQYADMFDFFTDIEYNIDILNSTEIKSIYYIEPKTIGTYAPNREDIWRWLQVLNDLYLILNGTFGRWGYLLCSDGYPTINGKRILIRGDLIG